MKTISVSVFSIVVIFLVSCSGVDRNDCKEVHSEVPTETFSPDPITLENNATQTSEYPLIPWYEGIEADFAQRVKDFEGTLEIVLYNARVYFNEATLEDGSIRYSLWIELDVDIKNISSHPIVYHEPQIISLLPSRDGLLQITMESKSGKVIEN